MKVPKNLRAMIAAVLAALALAIGAAAFTATAQADPTTEEAEWN